MKMGNAFVAPPAKKSLGQHFLHDTRVCKNIIALLDCETSDNIVEIGPGSGALTHFLEIAPHSQLLLIEKDQYWATVRQCERDSRTQAVIMDALTFDWARLDSRHEWKIAGNLPYNVASPLIWNIVAQAKFSRAVFMVQKEVGQRLSAKHATKAYGALSVWVQNYTRPKLQFCIGPGAFKPPPAVDSAVLTFEPKPDLPRHPHALARLIHICFQQRRKQLAGILKRSAIPNALEALEECRISSSARPEDLTPYQFRDLASTLFC